MDKKNGRSTNGKKKTVKVKKAKAVSKNVNKNKGKKIYNKEDVKVTIKLVLSLTTIVICALYIIGVYEDKSLLDIIQDVTTEAEAMITDSYKSHLVKLGTEAVPAAYRPNNQPVLDAKKNSYDWTNLYADDDYRYYYSGKNVVSKVGIDVSYYQGKIDWKKVKKSGVDYAIIRLGYRGFQNGALVLDSYYRYNMENAKKAGVDVGVYFFTQALTKEEAIEEAKFCIKNVKKYKLDYPIIIDTEAINNKKARSHITELNKDELTNICKAFCNTVDKAGYTSSIYASKSWFLYKLDLEKLEGYNKWLAHYTKATDYVYDFDMWQYTSDGHVPGIKGRVDMNIGLEGIDQ